MSAFSEATSKNAVLQSLLENGYRHCLYLGITGTDSPTVGTLEYEWRIMGAWAFFKEQVPFERLLERVQEEVPVLIGIKAYVMMTGMGSRASIARLSPQQFKEFITFFERQPVRWSMTEEEEFPLLQYCWK